MTAGIAQRAQLLELVLANLYGAGRLVARGAIPAAAIAGSAEYMRAVCGVKPPGRRVPPLSTRRCRPRSGRPLVGTRRPHAGASGAGYALENRLVLSRPFSSLLQVMNVEQAAPFLEAFRKSLTASTNRDEPRTSF